MTLEKSKAGAFIALLAFSWAAPSFGAALSSAKNRRLSATTQKSEAGRRFNTPLPVRLRSVRGRGLLLDVWINQTGPFVFALDTGSGISLVSADAARRAGLVAKTGRRISIGGLSRTAATSGEETNLDGLALGSPGNVISAGQRALIVPNLPYGIDGILDPTATFSTQGYEIDIPRGELRSLDSGERINLRDEPPGGTVVRWIREKSDQRPFVRLGDNRLALIDTGSNFGLAVTGIVVGTGNLAHRRPDSVRDLNGGSVESRTVAPSTVTIGALVLQKVPTEVLVGAPEDVPVIIGRGALYPFRMRFDPVNRLIEIAPSARD